MNARIWKLAAAVCLAATAAGCKQDTGKTPSPPGPSIAITPSATSVVANGGNTVSFSVTDTGGVAVTVTTDRGSFPGNVQSVLIPAVTGGTTGTVVLTTCNSGTNVGCAGVANIRASSTTGSATASVNFTALSSACQTNCGADPQCPGLACTLTAGGTGSCSATSPSACTSAPACTPKNGGVELCSGGDDEDCNNKIDCADTACDGQACDPSSGTSRCVSGQCTDLASGLAITIASDRQRLPANGSTTANLTVTLTSGGKPAANMSVTVSTTAGTLDRTTASTGRDGTATFALTAPSAPGTIKLTASPDLLPPGTVSASTTIVVPRLGSIQIPTKFALYPVMGVKTSGWNELNGVGVQVLDDQGQAYPDGQVVHFEQRALGGSAFAAPTVACATTPAPCSGYDGAVYGGGAADQVDKTGMATARLYSGTVAGTLALTATTNAGGVTVSATLPGIAVVGAKANLANFSIQCAPRNVPALAETDCSTSWVDAPFTCAALMKDRFGNLLGTSTQVFFASEAAAVGQVAWSSAYDPATPGTDQKDLGTATQIFQTLGAGLPFDVDPLIDPGPPSLQIEPSVEHALDGCGLRTHNPRDGVVTIIAIADGEEAFFDANGNGKYDPPDATSGTGGEPFVDQGEPFVDQNDSGAWEPGEWFLDVDGDGKYTAPNGTWDAQTKIWAQTIVVYTGWPTDTLVADATATPVTYLGTRWIDDVTPHASACTPTPEAALFSVESEIAGPPKEPATSVEYTAVASDMNLNVLTKATTYDAKAIGQVKAKVEYRGLPSYADLLGMSYQYWPCDQATSPRCASQCRTPVGTGVGEDGPCLMKPAISGFWCGIESPVLITGGSEPDGRFSAEFLLTTPWQNFGGEGKILHQAVPVSGYSDNNPLTPP